MFAGFLHISRLYAQDYWWYQLYIEHVKGISVDYASEMVTDSNERPAAGDEFLAKTEQVSHAKKRYPGVISDCQKKQTAGTFQALAVVTALH